MNQWSDYLAQMNRYLQQQDERIKALEERVRTIEKDRKTANQTTIEKIEYNFDQLKIERLDGSLHIGISPEDLSKVEDMSLGQQSALSPYPISQSPSQSPYSEVDSFLSNEAPSLIEQEMRTQKKPNDPQFIQTIIEDIRKQLPTRIAHYERLAKEKGMSETELYHYVTEQVKGEIRDSLQAFFNQEQQKGEKEQ
ncbi:spore germination protein GerPC [Aquibacillus sp. 3ASR75-11]|uniref:Spore germination protein GerPC n=1 Tax=Terrihalobacillus insolitus TaxID=2950438 RepID=A0A9X4AML9_9BACI|nr:spore germination protein GerPC [Terrihalobacillus insolitus]MDC3425587.1 spore germination protein GerPC [Terrihalobacillus insolitus]